MANGGYLVKPHIIRNVGDDPAVAYNKRKVPLLAGTTLGFLRRVMQGVVSDRDGTAYWTRIDGITSAGKTGTAQNPHGDHHAWYTAYAPADEPEIAMVVLIENAGHGGEIAAPIVRDFFKEYFLPPDVARQAEPVREAVERGTAGGEGHSPGQTTGEAR